MNTFNETPWGTTHAIQGGFLQHPDAAPGPTTFVVVLEQDGRYYYGRYQSHAFLHTMEDGSERTILSLGCGMTFLAEPGDVSRAGLPITPALSRSA